MNSKVNGKKRIEAKIHRRQPPPIPGSAQADSRDARLMQVFAGGGLFDPSVKDEISQIFATTLFSENSPLLEQEEVKKVEPIGAREDSSALFSSKRLAAPVTKENAEQSIIDPTSGMIDLRRLVSNYPTATRDTSDSVMFIKGSGFRPDHESPVLQPLPRRISPLIKVAAILGGLLLVVGIVVLSVFAAIEDEEFYSEMGGSTRSLSAGISPVSAARAKDNRTSPSTVEKAGVETGQDTWRNISKANIRDEKDEKKRPKRSREGDGSATNEIDKLLEGAISKPSRERSRKKSRHNSRAKESATASKPHKLSRAQVKSGLSAISGRVRQCGQGRAQGIITMEVVINGDGRVARVHPIGTYAGTPVGVCATRAVRRARFPEFTGPRLTVQYPFPF